MPSLNPFPLLLALLLIVCAAAPHAAAPMGRESARDALVGGWKPIEDLKDPHVHEIADFAVSEANKQLATSGGGGGDGGLLTLRKVVKGETQVVAGTNYRLVVIVVDSRSGATAKYQAVVWEKTWENFRRLTSFKQLN